MLGLELKLLPWDHWDSSPRIVSLGLIWGGFSDYCFIGGDIRTLLTSHLHGFINIYHFIMRQQLLFVVKTGSLASRSHQTASSFLWSAHTSNPFNVIMFRVNLSYIRRYQARYHVKCRVFFSLSWSWAKSPHLLVSVSSTFFPYPFSCLVKFFLNCLMDRPLILGNILLSFRQNRNITVHMLHNNGCICQGIDGIAPLHRERKSCI